MGMKKPESVVRPAPPPAPPPKKPITTNISVTTDPQTLRTVQVTPSAYRLARKPDGTTTLQAAYLWWGGKQYGHEWRDIPTVCVED